MKNFNAKKMIAAAAYVCEQNGGKFDKLALIKVLYIAERESICETFNPLTGDEMLKFKFGPVLKRLHDALRGLAEEDFQTEWNAYFSNPPKSDTPAKHKGADDVKLKARPDMDELSYADERFLDKAVRFVNSCKLGSLVNRVHEFPEWDIAVKRGARAIDVADILSSYRPDLTQDEVLEIKNEIQPA